MSSMTSTHAVGYTHTPFPIGLETASSSSISTTFSLSSSSPTATTVMSATTTSSSFPSTTSSIFPGNGKYVYVGCYNETTQINGTGGMRALSGGSLESLTTMTVPTCLKFCNMDGYRYAGLEYGSECWCSQYLSVFAQRLSDSDCSFLCKGNSSQTCGASLIISVYENTVSSGNAFPRPRNVLTQLLTTSLVALALLLPISL